MESEEFQMGVSMLSMNGLPKTEKEQLEVWFRLLAPKLKAGEFDAAAMRMCETVTFYPNTNVVALVLETVEIQRKEKNSKALQEKKDVAKKEDERQKLLIMAEFEEDPEAFRNRRKSQALAAQIGRVM